MQMLATAGRWQSIMTLHMLANSRGCHGEYVGVLGLRLTP